MRIKSIKQKKGRASRVTLLFTDGSRLELSAEVVMRAGLGPGAVLDEPSLESLQQEDLSWRCKESALSLLSYRPRSEKELRQGLAMRKYPPETIDACLADLARANLIDDAAFATLLTRDRVRSKPVGKNRMKAELRAKGIAPEPAEQAIEEAYAGEQDEMELARRAAKKFRRKEDEAPLPTRRRLYAFLGRRGFPPDVISQVMVEVLGEED